MEGGETTTWTSLFRTIDYHRWRSSRHGFFCLFNDIFLYLSYYDIIIVINIRVRKYLTINNPENKVL